MLPLHGMVHVFDSLFVLWFFSGFALLRSKYVFLAGTKRTFFISRGKKKTSSLFSLHSLLDFVTHHGGSRDRVSS